MSQARGATLSAGLTAITLVIAATLAVSGAMPSRVAIALSLAFVPYGALLVARPIPLRATLVFAAVAGATLVLAPSVLSDDLYRYLWDGRVLRAGLDPYALAPADPALAALRDEWWPHINHPRIPTIYPPLAQALFGAVGAVWHHPVALKAVALVAHLGTVPVVARLASHAGVDPHRAAALLALNPLALSESALGGHVDAFVALFVAIAVLAGASGKAGRAAAAFVAAAGVKLVGLLVAPLLWRTSRAATVMAIVIAALCLVPLLGAGDERAVGGFGQYARRWGGNAGAFVLAESAIAAAVEHTHGIAPGRVRFEGLRERLARWQGTALDPMASFQREKKERGDPAELEASVVGSLGARALVALLLFLVAFRLVRRGRSLLDSSRALLLLTLLLLPQLHPWYLLWLLPLEAALGGGAGLVFSAVMLVAYTPLDGWIASRSWAESAPGVGFEHGLVWAFWLAEGLRSWWVKRSEVEALATPQAPTRAKVGAVSRVQGPV